MNRIHQTRLACGWSHFAEGKQSKSKSSPSQEYSDMSKDSVETGAKLRIRGYMSRGESVPEVIMTDWNRSNTGLIARLASMQLKWSTGSGIERA